MAAGGPIRTDKDEVNPVGGIIEGLTLTNGEFGPALAALIVDESPEDEIVGPIDFRSLSVREFGTIYEGLLESELSVAGQPLTVNKDGVYLPAGNGDEVEVEAGEVYLHNQSGVRKSTGSYFTKPFAVDHLISHSVDPTLKEHLERVKAHLDENREADAAAQLFDFRVADIAMGSGHFLTAVVDRLEAHYTNFLAENQIPQVSRELDLLRETANEALGQLADTVEIENSSLLRRLIARRCVYGVDLNPLSVELARVGMWIHTFVPGLPLSFLDHNLVAGDSLTGIGTIEEATAELVSTGAQASFFDDPLLEALGKAREPLRRLANIADATIADVAQAREAAAAAEEAVAPVAGLFDLVVAARTGEAAPPSITSIDQLLTLETAHASEVAGAMRAVHFPVAFPEVFLREGSGFDVVVGNPPWEKVKVEAHTFWGRFEPGLRRGLTTREREPAIQSLRLSRPDLVELLDLERQQAERLKRIVRSGPYELGSGDTELARVFTWRFWHLLKVGGRAGVILPRGTIFASPGMASWRRTVLREGGLNVTILVNGGHWIFDEVDVRYTVTLAALNKVPNHEGVVLDGPYNSARQYDEGRQRHPASITAKELLSWDKDAALPAVRDQRDIDIYRIMLEHPRFGDDRSDWQFRPLTETHATGDKDLFTFTEDHIVDMWPVYSGSSFNIWNPETGQIYAWVDPDEIQDHLFEKRRRQARQARSAFSTLPSEVLSDKGSLPCLHPRIAFRDVTKFDNSRSCIVALLPPMVVPQHKAPYLLRIRGNEAAEAFLLGMMSSRVFDWLVRRKVETTMSFGLLNWMPVPAMKVGDPVCQKLVEISGRLAAIDERYGKWAAAVGVPLGSVTEGEKPDLLAELDACVAHLFGLNERDLRHLYATFHHGWNHEPWTEAVLEHFRRLAPARVGA